MSVANKPAVQEFSLPGISQYLSENSKILEGYSVKYIKADLDDLGSLATLEEVETRALRGDEIVLIEKDKFSFMQQYFIVLKYLEKNQ